MKKLLITSALAAVAISSSAYSEIKISGELEETFTSYSYDKASEQITGSNSMGSEANVKFSGSKNLDNGMVAAGSIRLEDKGGSLYADQKAFSLTSGGFKVELGIDTGSSIDGNVVAHVGQQAEDVNAFLGTNLKAVIATPAHDKEHIGFSYNAAGVGEFTLNYSPSLTTSVNANGVTDSGGSATEYLFQGGLGVEGLTVKVGRQVTAAANSGASGASGGDKTETVLGAMYKFGKFAVAYTDRDMDDETITTEVDKVKSMSASVNVSDNLSMSIERMTSHQVGDTTDETSVLVGVAYNMGGLGVEAYYGTSSDIGGTAGSDAKALQLRTVFGF